ncbi:DUF501 domain-containing protein [Phytohalomonas tamaricis]|uniref:DUF501 domain-containing protein n=1 Tax=Phytohalomonas tamaricis TaxID=2081032 RepID=UPI000D0AE968|nr:DUF501 domain-containing protein [Phytohalomonas tamaricis]
MVIQTDQAPDTRQLAIITEQLGRAPRGIQAVTATDGEGTPLVLRMDSLIDGKPFPTLYWLSSDRLKIELSHLEAAGVIKTLEAILKEDPDFMAAYRKSHEDYVARRWQSMSKAVQQEAAARGYDHLLRERGVGGISNWAQVRCLHTQYAHHLCGTNVIGQWIDEYYPEVAASLP